MKRTITTVLVVAAGLLIGANPAAGLSCAQPEPFDMEAAIAAADAAAIGTITSISARSKDDSGDAELVLEVEVTEVFKGTVPRRLKLDRTTTVWGPYFEEGVELALLVHDGFVTDGLDSLCGPFFSADDMRQVAGDPVPPQPEPQGWFVVDLWRGLLNLISLLLGR